MMIRNVLIFLLAAQFLTCSAELIKWKFIKAMAYDVSGETQYGFDNSKFPIKRKIDDEKWKVIRVDMTIKLFYEKELAELCLSDFQVKYKKKIYYKQSIFSGGMDHGTEGCFKLYEESEKKKTKLHKQSVYFFVPQPLKSGKLISSGKSIKFSLSKKRKKLKKKKALKIDVLSVEPSVRRFKGAVTRAERTQMWKIKLKISPRTKHYYKINGNKLRANDEDGLPCFVHGLLKGEKHDTWPIITFNDNIKTENIVTFVVEAPKGSKTLEIRNFSYLLCKVDLRPFAKYESIKSKNVSGLKFEMLSAKPIKALTKFDRVQRQGETRKRRFSVRPYRGVIWEVKFKIASRTPFPVKGKSAKWNSDDLGILVNDEKWSKSLGAFNSGYYLLSGGHSIYKKKSMSYVPVESYTYYFIAPESMNSFTLMSYGEDFARWQKPAEERSEEDKEIPQ